MLQNAKKCCKLLIFPYIYAKYRFFGNFWVTQYFFSTEVYDRSQHVILRVQEVVTQYIQ